MARYTGPVCRLCRRERMKLFLKGTKCETMRCPIERRPYPPGMHGRGRIRERVLAPAAREAEGRRIYGLLEKQFRNVYEEGERSPGITGENLLRMLELRLDNIVFRANFAASRNQARQFVRHGHVTVNGKRVTIPSQALHKGDVVALQAEGAQDDRGPPQPRHPRPQRPRSGSRSPRPTSRPPCAICRSASRSTCRCASSSSSSSTPSSPPSSATRPQDTKAAMLIIQRPEIEAGEPEGQHPDVHASRRSSPASATRSATACAARCSRRSPAPR